MSTAIAMRPQLICADRGHKLNVGSPSFWNNKKWKEKMDTLYISNIHKIIIWQWECHFWFCIKSTSKNILEVIFGSISILKRGIYWHKEWQNKPLLKIYLSDSSFWNMQSLMYIINNSVTECDKTPFLRNNGGLFSMDGTPTGFQLTQLNE